MTNSIDRNIERIIDSNSPFDSTEGSPLQDEYMSTSMRKWANENPKTTVGIGLVATAFLAFGGYKLSQSMRAAKSVLTPLGSAADDLYAGVKGTANTRFGLSVPGSSVADDGLLHGLKQEGAIKDLFSVPGRNEEELIAALKQGAHGQSYVIQGLRTLKNPNEMETLVSHYLREHHPEAGIGNLMMGKSFAPLETRSLWDRVLYGRLFRKELELRATRVGRIFGNN